MNIARQIIDSQLENIFLPLTHFTRQFSFGDGGLIEMELSYTVLRMDNNRPSHFRMPFHGPMVKSQVLFLLHISNHYLTLHNSTGHLFHQFIVLTSNLKCFQVSKTILQNKHVLCVGTLFYINRWYFFISYVMKNGYFMHDNAIIT